MLKRNPAPKDILIDDVILIVQEDKPFDNLIHSKFIVLEIDPSREDGRTIKPGQFNGNPVRLINSPNEDYWTKMEFVQVDKRTINGHDIYYETSLDKTIEKNTKNLFDFLDRMDDLFEA